ncbi:MULTISPECIES: GNAT family N-acetyltransferase [unclassified Agrococcus]|uniref:GNAT family N-acetyltransferase n=1 Tax=unclassified Agrococcus TaxID=2615065 RepID=UPI0036161EA1
MSFAAPRPVAARDDLAAFRCGTRGLDEWLRQHARENERRGASRTFVSIDEQGHVAAFYCLSAFTVQRADLGDGWDRMPPSLPVTLIGRLAVHADYQGTGLGFAMLKDAVVRAIGAAQAVGSVAVVAHVANPSARSFYERFGFSTLPGDENTFILTMADVEATVARLAER